MRIQFWLPVALSCSLASIGNAQEILIGGTLTNSTGLGLAKITLVKSVLQRISNLSWEIGTHAIALMEYDFPDTLSVFSADTFPPSASPYPTSVNSIAASILATRPPNILPLTSDGSAGDPASMGNAVLVANWTVVARNKSAYGLAAQNQVDFLLTKVPRTPDGAISHRNDKVQLWADFVYMAPPFLAYYGILTGNTTLIQAAYDQCRLYRQYLRDPNGLWRHIVLGGAGEDPGYWATGNAWAAAGMLRVMAMMLHSDFAAQFPSQISDLASWTTEIVESSFAYQKAADSLFPNYFNSTNNFSDCASTALMSAVSYRLAQLSLGNSTVPSAELARQKIYASIDPFSGYLFPVVDPLNFQLAASVTVPSPEAESFVLFMESGWRDWVAAGGNSLSETTPAKALNPSPTPTPIASMTTKRASAYQSNTHILLSTITSALVIGILSLL